MKKKGLPGTGNVNYEPPVSRIIDDGTFYSIVAELHDIDEGKIRISLENNILTLKWHDLDMGHHEKEICLPCRMRLINKKFQGGILKISLEKVGN
ncbi:MAG TPA: Hsp20/alpha crystallin family protein [Methanoregulaceae archaeon]|nr:Hsp20/alpha crystallin family protein [Methanoregulaceae archaeon]